MVYKDQQLRKRLPMSDLDVLIESLCCLEETRVPYERTIPFKLLKYKGVYILISFYGSMFAFSKVFSVSYPFPY